MREHIHRIFICARKKYLCFSIHPRANPPVIKHRSFYIIQAYIYFFLKGRSIASREFPHSSHPTTCPNAWSLSLHARRNSPMVSIYLLLIHNYHHLGKDPHHHRPSIPAFYNTELFLVLSPVKHKRHHPGAFQLDLIQTHSWPYSFALSSELLQSTVKEVPAEVSHQHTPHRRAQVPKHSVPVPSYIYPPS